MLRVAKDSGNNMPDGDKFYWGVRGTGSRTFLNLARNVSTVPDIVADQGARVVTAQLKRPLMQRMVRESLGLLEFGLPRVEADCSAPIPGPAVICERFRGLRHEAMGDDFATVTLCAAEGVYERLYASGQAFAREDLKRELLASSTQSTLGHAVFNAKRVVLMAETGRSYPEQHIFERELTIAVADRMRSVGDRICESTTAQAIRSPRRRYEPEDFTLERLHVPLAL